MSYLQYAPKPASRLGYHRLLAPKAGVRVSPLCLGAMNFGDAWKGYMGECNKETSFSILDFFFEQGGNFIDTANNYQGEESEEWLGEWMESRKNRDQMVIATKFTTKFPSGKGGEKIVTNFCGNSSKSLRISLEASLRKMKISYVDILYVHWWDFSTSVPELMQALNRMVNEGKILYLGVSDTPAWIVSKANEYARAHGLAEFVIYQGKWNAAYRDFERDIIPMCESEGMALAPWGALGGGAFKSKAQREGDAKEGRQTQASEDDIKVTEKLEQVAEKKGTIITSIALAYVMHKAPYVFPIVGGRKVDHLKGNIDALGIELTQEDIDDIESAYPFKVGFPMGFIFDLAQRGEYRSGLGTGDVTLVKTSGYIDSHPRLQPIKPRKLD